MDPILHYKKMGHLFNRADRNRQLSELVVIIDTGAELSATIGTVEELSTSHEEWTMTGEEEAEEEEDEKQAMCNE